MKITISNIFIIILFYSFKTYGQGSSQLPKLPDIVSPTPSVAELGKYGSYPVSMNTGIPSINFPLFNVDVAEISIPFSLSYHSGGIKVNQESTEVGLGWSISGPMVIHRNVLGVPDESESGNFNMEPLDASGFLSKQTGTGSTKDDNYFYLKAMADGAGRDSRPDIFSYNIPGKSGQFIFAPDRTFKTFPYEPIKISLSNPYGDFRFTIVDEKGTTYKFTEQNKVLIDDNPSYRTHYITDLYLTEIISNNKKDTIKFEYLSEAYVKDQVSYSQIIGRELIVNSNGLGSPNLSSNIFNGVEEYSISTSAQEEKFLKKIVYRGGEIIFNYNTVRQDRNTQSAKSLDEILIYNSEIKLVKKIQFDHDYFTATFNSSGYSGPSLKRLKLTGFKEIPVNGIGQDKTYLFEYNNSIPIPRIGDFSQDYWGYFNGKVNGSLIPVTSVNGSQIMNPAVYFKGTYQSPQGLPDSNVTFSVGSGNRSVDTTKIQMGMLKKITYPTKGYSIFEFEPHSYKSSSGSTMFGVGLRVKSISSFDKTDVLLSKESHKYGENENGLASKLFNEELFFKNYEDYTLESFEGSQGQEGLCGGWISVYQRRYMGLEVYSSVNYNGNPLIYTEVNKYEGVDSNDLFKTKYIYSSISEDLATTSSQFVNSSNYAQMVPVWTSSQLLEEIYYKKSGLDYLPVKKINYSYNLYHNESINSLFVKEVQKYVDMGICYGFLPGSWVEPNFIQAGYFKYRSVGYRMSQKIKTDISQSDSIQVSNFYTYGNSYHLFPTETTSTNSQGEVEITKVIYPDDISGSSLLSGGNMTETDYLNISKLKSNQQHQISIPIQTEKSVNGSPAIITRTLYKDWGNGLMKPEFEEFSLNGGSLIKSIQFHNYSSFGNPIEISKNDGLKVSYLWACNDLLPIGKVENGDLSEISLTSFEYSTDKGGWTYNGTYNTTTYKTGKRAYNLGSGSVTKTGISASSSAPYKVGFWARRTSGTGNVNVGGQTEALTTAWKWVEKTITSSSLTISGSSVIIDELRLHPADAMMTSYTYEPLVGMTSQTDPRGYTMIYIYDSTNRLVTIKDEDGYIIEQYEYNYSH
ncbi:RHS repeat protein [Algoriphagus aestuarii]|nr:RHS repeat protein [Algoriphagus aestuarii]